MLALQGIKDKMPYTMTLTRETSFLQPQIEPDQSLFIIYLFKELQRSSVVLITRKIKLHLEL